MTGFGYRDFHHQMGVEVDGMKIPDALKKAKLDWSVEKVPLFAKAEGKAAAVPVKGNFALMRKDTKSVLDVVGNQYTPIQNSEAFEFFKEFVEAGDAKMEIAGMAMGGSLVWGLANMGQSFSLKGKDEVKNYLLVASPHRQGKAMICKMTALRSVCSNAISRMIRGAGNVFRHAHRTSFDKAVRDEAKKVLGIAREDFAEFEANARKLQAKLMTKTDIVEVLAPIYQAEWDGNAEKLLGEFEKLASPRMKNVMLALEKAPGAQPGNAWGALNAVTYFSDHMASRSDDKRFTNALIGRTSREKEKVYQALLAA